jgi:outer membrane protein OmpA-like peptidoglycan-associated protein
MIGYKELSLALLAGATALACGAATPSKELVDARRTYDRARASNAAQLAPDHLLTAKQALERAERAHEEEPESFEERSLAYIAQRKAALAMSRANLVNFRRETEAADEELKATQENLLKKSQSEAARTAQSLKENQSALDRVRKELAAQDSKLSQTSQELKGKEEALRKQQAELEARQRELEKERKAREEAEKRAAAAMASLEEIARVKEEQRGLVITLDGAVLFVTGKASLLPIAQQKLSKVAEALQEMDPSKKIVVEGHTDSVGSDAANMKLSQARADSVRAYLISQGVPSDRITAIGKGESRPVADNKTPEGRANNRRVEIVIK